MAYDLKCLEFAEYFLGAAPVNLKVELAQHIQDQVELWIESQREERMGSLPKPGQTVFSRPECIFHYCPTEENCKDKCCFPTTAKG